MDAWISASSATSCKKICCLSVKKFERKMHPLYEKASGLTGEIIAAAIEVHKTMGPGLIESIYEWCLMKELELRGFHVSNQAIVTIRYKTFCRDEPLRYDVLVEQSALVEVKAVEDVHPIHKAKLLSYMKLIDVPIGLLINFHVEKLTDGVSRLILPGSASYPKLQYRLDRRKQRLRP